MKKLRKIVSVVLSLAMCLSLAAPAFAASFDDLQAAIDTELPSEAEPAEPEPGTDVSAGSEMPAEPGADVPAESDTPAKPPQNGDLVGKDDSGNDHYGFGWSQDSETQEWSHGIEAWDDDEGNRNVELKEDVEHKETDTTGTITVGKDQNVNLDLNDQNITGSGKDTAIQVEEGGDLTITGKDENTPEDDAPHNTISNKPSESAEPAEDANGIDVEGNLALDGVTVTGTDTAVNVEEGGTAEIENSTITGNRTGVKFVDDSSVTFIDDQNVVTNNNKNISGDGKVSVKLAEKEYKVDAETAETLLADKDSVAAQGDNWILARNGTVIYTGTGDKDHQLTQGIVSAVLRAASADGKEVTGFIIPEGVSKIGTSAFNSCTNLKTIRIPDSVTSIEMFAFYGCSSLESIIIPRNVTSISGNKVFFNCNSLKRVEILGSVDIPSYFFDGSSSLQYVKISELVKGIGIYAFRNCTELTTIEWPQNGNLEIIMTEAFGGCTGLTGELVIPEGVKTIHPRAFDGCTGLKKVTIPATVTTIWGNAFNGCSGIKSFWVYPKEEQTANAITAAFNQYYNVFVVTDDVQLYRYGDIITFKDLAENDLILSEDDGEVTVNAPATSSMSIIKKDVTTAITFSEDGAVVTVGPDGKLIISDLEKDVAVTVTDATGNRAEWKLRGGITKTWGMPEISSGSTITASDGTSITSFSSALIGKDGYKVTEIITKGNPTTLTNKDGNTVVLTSGNGEVKVAIDGTVTVPGNSSVDDGNGFKTFYSCGATIKDGQITSGFDVAVDKGTEGQTIIKPAEGGDPVTVDTVTGVITIPNGGSTTMNGGANELSYLGGAVIDRQGNVASNGSVEYVYGDKSGSITPPAGSSIAIASDGTITVPASSTVDGEVSLCGGYVGLDGVFHVIHTEVTDAAKAATCTETGLTEGKHCSVCGEVLVAQESVPVTDHTPGEAVRENEVAAQIGVEGSYDEVVYCSVCERELSRERVTIPARPIPAIPDDGADATPDAATIADQEVPLAGLMPLAQLLEELRLHEEIPAAELPADFKWLDHEYAQAIYWGLQEELVIDTEEKPLDPDEVLTVGLLREVLVNFVALYMGLEDFTVTLAGEDDEMVMDLGERLTVFYGELEAYLAHQEDKAA